MMSSWLQKHTEYTGLGLIIRMLLRVTVLISIMISFLLTYSLHLWVGLENRIKSDQKAFQKGKKAFL